MINSNTHVKFIVSVYLLGILLKVVYIIFFVEADFGYVKDRRRELIEYCKEDAQKDKIKRSSLRCTKV